MAAATTVKEALWLRKFLVELRIPVTHATEIGTDNQGYLALLQNPIHHIRSKHIWIRYFFVRDAIGVESVKFYFVSTERMIAYFLTKGVPPQKLNLCHEICGVFD